MCSAHVTRESGERGLWEEKKRKRLIEGEEVRQARFKQNAFHAELTDDVDDLPPPGGPKTFRLDEKKNRGSLSRFSVDSGRREIVRPPTRYRSRSRELSPTPIRDSSLTWKISLDLRSTQIASHSILRQSEGRTLRSSRRNTVPRWSARSTQHDLPTSTA